MMQCTAEEIEIKRKIAMERLRQTQLKKMSNSPNLKNQDQKNVSSSPINARFNFKSPRKGQATSSKPYEKAIPTVETKQFYGIEKKITAKCSLISDDRFLVDLDTFHTPAIEVFKSMPTRNYRTKTRQWDFHLKDYNMLLSKIQALQPCVFIEKLPNFVIKCMTAPQNDDYLSIDLGNIDPELRIALMPFQEEGVRFAIDKGGRALIADDMGLGKTFQALAVASYFRDDWPLLVVTTASMKNVWEETIHKYLPSVPLLKVQYMKTKNDYIGDAIIVIVSHDMMSRYSSLLVEKKFGVIIIDESHIIKNFKAKCTQAATTLAKSTKRIVLLSGTPALSRPSELYSQLALLDDRFFGNFFEYSKRYCDGRSTNFGWDATGKSNLQELELILARKFMIRRTKEQVLKMLPNKVQEVVTLDVDLSAFSADDRKCLNSIAAKYVNHKKGSEKHALLLTFFSETAKIKIPSVCSYILQVLQTKQKFLVFAHHQKMLDAITSILTKKNVTFIRIDGSTNSEQRKYFVDKFQTNDEYLVAVLSITAANAGITLTAASLVLFAELHWNPSILSQAESRAHRIGQTGAVFVKYLLAPGTADDSIWPLLQEKEKILSEVGLSKASFKDALVSKQYLSDSTNLTKDLNISTVVDRTTANTLDITTFFKSNKTDDSSCSKMDTSECFDDELDEALENFDF